MDLLLKSATTLALASKGNPIVSIIVVFIFYLAFVQFEILIEHLIFGKRFEHWVDVIFISVFMAYAGYVVWACALINGVVK